jgi:NAD(P)-dependent dehydrogenase (short-subunit alcohol dehydrogenase family)
MKLEGKVAIVTGGASGLGEAAVREFIKFGAKVAIWDLTQDLGVKLVQELGSNSFFIRVDVTSEESVKNALAETVSRFGKVDVLLNSAGILIGRMIVTAKTVHPLEDFERVIRVNLTGTFNVSRLVAKQMSTQAEIEGERGVIIHVASIAAFEGQRGQCAYSASKGGVVGLTLPMARDLQSYKIRVNSMAPGLFAGTRIFPNGHNKDLLSPMIKEIPSGRTGHHHEFAHAARFLVENSYMNGAVLRCDGGIRLPNI